MKIHCTRIVFIHCFLFFVTSQSFSQQTATLPQLLQIAETNYPLLKSKKLDVDAAEEHVNASNNTLIPTLDAGYQMNYATYNNITGMSYPQNLMPISGPPSAGNNYDGVFGSAANLTFNWQPLTFGQRTAQIGVSSAGLEYAHADARNELFQHKIKVINTYLDLLTADELVKVSENNLKKTEANLRSVHALVVSGIRPGVDTALLKSEVSKAKIELLNSQKYKEQTQIQLSQLLASDETYAFTETTFFTKLPSKNSSLDSLEHPLIALHASNLERSLSTKKALSRTSMPTLSIWGTTYARGSGISYTGSVNATEGLAFQRFNYGVGLQLTIPLLQYFRVKPYVQQQEFLIQSNQEKLNEVQLHLKKQQQQADTSLSKAFAVVKESPLFLESATFSYSATQSRYQSGMATLSDLMQTQYNLLRAETDYKISYMNVWKALLFKSAVNGDLNLFLNNIN